MQLFQINQSEESSKITINAHTPSCPLHELPITWAAHYRCFTLDHTIKDVPKCSIEHYCLSAHLYISTCHNYVNILSRDPAWWQTSWQCPASSPPLDDSPVFPPASCCPALGHCEGGQWPLWPSAQWQILIYCPPPYPLTQSYITPTFMLLELTNVFTEKTNCAEITGK